MQRSPFKKSQNKMERLGKAFEKFECPRADSVQGRAKGHKKARRTRREAVSWISKVQAKECASYRGDNARVYKKARRQARRQAKRHLKPTQAGKKAHREQAKEPTKKPLGAF